MVKRRYCISLIPLTKLTSFKLALNSPHRNLRLHSSSGKQIQWVPRADACDGFLCLKQDIWPRNELDIVVSKSASFAMVSHKKNKMAGRQPTTSLVYSTYVFFMYQGYKIFLFRKANCTHHVP